MPPSKSGRWTGSRAKTMRAGAHASKTINVRLTPEEHQRLRERATAAGLTDSDFVRRACGILAPVDGGGS